MKTTHPSRKTIFALLASVSVCSQTVFGLGIRIADQDPTATARGNAFTATADDPSAIYYNPAGITQLQGQNVSAGVYDVWLNSHFKGSGMSLNTKDQLQGIPQLYYTAHCPEHPVTFGLGVYAPYGFSLEWPTTAPFSGVAQKGSLEYLTFNPVVAFKPHSTLSVAMGLTLNYGDTELRANQPAITNSSSFFVPASNFRFRGNDFTPGFNAGILWQPWEKHSFGINYRSSTKMNFGGHATTELPAFGFNSRVAATTEHFEFPRNIVFAYSFRPNTNWNFEFDADWTDWDNLNTVVLRQNGTTNTVAALPFNWQSSWFYEFGATRYLKDGWSISAGYIYSENSVPDKSFNAIVPDSDRHIFSVGVGKKYTHLSWSAAYQFAWGPTRTISGASPVPGQNPNGTYEFTSHALTFNLGYSF